MNYKIKLPFTYIYNLEENNLEILKNISKKNFYNALEFRNQLLEQFSYKKNYLSEKTLEIILNNWNPTKKTYH